LGNPLFPPHTVPGEYRVLPVYAEQMYFSNQFM